MSRFIPNTTAQQEEMLREAGFSDFGGLFADIPENLRCKKSLRLPEAMAEPQLDAHLKKLAAANKSGLVCFRGAGAYDHYIPAAVGALLARQEFYTAYTPYQPEISQGTLQAIFEFQSMMSSLTGMDVANASMYDGGTALAEAANVACGATRRDEIILTDGLNPRYGDVIRTAARFRGRRVAGCACADGVCDFDALEKAVSEKTAAVVLQSPNFFGCVEDIKKAAGIAHKKGALLIAACEPFSLAVLESPGALGADLAAGEGQPLGIPMNYGGPGLGFLAAKRPFMRRLPGRIVGLTRDCGGRRAFVLTLQAREQHIRREKATSNICTNSALNALAATIFLSLMGKEGLRLAALQSLEKAHYACGRLTATGRFAPAFHAPFFSEFTLKTDGDIAGLNRKLLGRGILGGLELGAPGGEPCGRWLVAVTEKRTRAEIDALAEEAGRI